VRKRPFFIAHIFCYNLLLLFYSRLGIDSDLQSRAIRGNVALLAEFKYTYGETRTETTNFVVGTTHIFWDPTQADVKLLQTQVILEQLQTFTLGSAHLPVLFMGDFNSLPGSEVYQYMRNNSFESAFELYRDEGEPEFTNVNGVVTTPNGDTTPAFIGTLDYIFYDKSKYVSIFVLCCSSFS